MTFLRGIWKPELYHGRRRRPPFFEGWYFKVVDASGQHRLAVIPGVFIGHGPGASHSFIQTLDGVTGRTAYHRYPIEEFWASSREFDIRIGSSRFYAGGMQLDIDRPDGSIRGDLRFSDATPWPVTLSSPGIMGPYAFAPFMECYHGVLSLDHSITGSLILDGAAHDFTAGRGYTEKDWGQAFPKAWIWTQSNHFERPGTCLTASVAIIPWLRGAFPGFIVGLWHDRNLYRFATYTGAHIERLDVTDTHVTLHINGRTGPRRARHRLEIVAWRAEGGLLRSPERVAMLRRVLETMTARLDVRLVELHSGEEDVVFEGAGNHAGLEIVGPIEEIQRLARS